MKGTVNRIDGKWYVSAESEYGVETYEYPVHKDDDIALDIIYPDSIGMEVEYELFGTNDLVSGQYVQVARISDIYDKQAAYVPTITEEEIDEAAWKFNSRPSLDVEFIREGFRQGAKWAIEQLNKR